MVLATQFKATPPATQRFSDFVSSKSLSVNFYNNIGLSIFCKQRQYPLCTSSIQPKFLFFKGEKIFKLKIIFTRKAKYLISIQKRGPA